MMRRLNQRDVLFVVVDTLMPGRVDREHVAERLMRDETQLETMLDEDRLFQRLMREENVLVHCLFLAGMFPEYINGRYRYPLSGQFRPRMRGRLIQKVEDYEAYGRAFYRTAAEHEVARREGLDDVLITLSEHFILAEKPLAFVAKRYLQFARHTLFGV